MKKWFEWCAKKYHKDNGVEILGPDTDLVDAVNHWVEQQRVEFKENKAFPRDEYYSALLTQTYENLDLNQLHEWIFDSEFDRLYSETGRQLETPNLSTDFKRTVVQPSPIFRDIANITNAQMRLTIQRPGDMFPLHYDRKKEEKKVNGDVPAKRWLVMLEDQMPGQCLFFNNNSISWKKGHVIYWDHITVPHGSANFGFYPRKTLKITLAP